ncbi:MAG: hypothetical protein V8S95_13165, partial [Odoribacter sp.]
MRCTCLIGRQICYPGHIDGDNTHASGAPAGTEEASGFLRSSRRSRRSLQHKQELNEVHIT